ncbi:Fur family transcriptional regulator [Paenibacillus planticolens]|uniref:Transcriptional repressor n=1 Tax=Paenibacillus planticolens TaxID=2654976 RepID=A0ABX1ZI33_9BACL|nr:Fur family transcriptional regulator [Paenibacillus planticolens]NOU99107.1 transcriptional repressor [Paenibacillus planticolens]
MCKDTVIDKMKEAGLRITPQRVHIVELLYQLSHPTADQIYLKMTEKFPYVSHATVYNTLKKLKVIGVVRELSNGDKSSHFEMVETEHWHFNCKVCGEMYDLEAHKNEVLMAYGTNNYAFQVDSFRVEFYGVCAKCNAK